MGYSGYFVSIEGGEGAGKTTLIKELKKLLNSNGCEVVTTREPGGTLLSEAIRSWLLIQNTSLPICPPAELLLFLAARAQHIQELILPSLRNGKVVICDRFHDSTIAYQGTARGLGPDKVQRLCLMASDGMQPDLTFYVDVEPEEGIRRVKGLVKAESKAGELDRIEGENISFHQQVRRGFLTIAEQNPERVYVLNGNLTREDVLEQAWTILKARIKRKMGRG